MEIHDAILIVTSLFGLIGTLTGAGGLVAYLKVRTENTKILAEVSKMRAETVSIQAGADKTESEAWVMLVQAQGATLTRQQDRIVQLEERVKTIPYLQQEIDELRQQVVELGGRPKTGPLGRKDK